MPGVLDHTVRAALVCLPLSDDLSALSLPWAAATDRCYGER